MKSGMAVSKGTMKTPSKVRVSLDIPSSISFKPVTASAAEKPTCNKSTFQR